MCISSQFEEALNQSEPEDDLRKLVDPRLGDGYPLDSVSKVQYNIYIYLKTLLKPEIKCVYVVLKKGFFFLSFPHTQLAHLAKVCTHENPQLRPTMRSIVVALMTLSSSTEDWDVGSFYRNQGLVNLMSGR